ncbi:MAG: Rep catalytic domain protein [Cressdnaviricota sp.]|nr:MAG: Rep catalytic domain protein [Cressdnaviricota sp.]
MVFRLRGKRFHLIYARCNLAPLLIYTSLNALGNENDNPVTRLRVASEKHQDGSDHRHVTVAFTRAWDRTGLNAERLFDIINYHPQIKPKRTKRQWINAVVYLEKDGNWEDFAQPGHGFEAEEDADETTLVDTAKATNNLLEYLRIVERQKRNPYLARWVWDAVAAQRDTDRTILAPDTPEILFGRINDHNLRELEYDGNGRNGPVSMILQGPTSIGKTSWALLNTPKPALWVKHSDDLKYFREGYHISIIVDDLDLKHTPRSNQLNWVDRRNPTTVHIRYRVATIPAGVHRVFTCNRDYVPVDIDDPAILARVNYIIL